MRRLLPIALLVLLAITLLPGLRAVGPLDRREARDVVVAGQSATDGEWLSPAYAGAPDFDRPLGAYLHELLVRRVPPARLRPAPDDPGPSRAVRAAFAFALALVVAAIGTRAFGARAGWLAACALASSVGLPFAARADGGQLLATLCAWLGAGGLLAVARGRPRGATLTRYAAWLSLGLAFVCGGPLSALWPLGGFALYFALARNHAGFGALRPLEGLAIVAGVALPWYGMMTALFGGAFLSHVPWFPYAGEARGPLLAGPLVALSFVAIVGFPWTTLLGAALRDASDPLRHGPRGPVNLRDSGHTASVIVALGFAASVPVALYPGPPLTAALPALPAVALLCGRFLDRVLDGGVKSRPLTHATWMAALLGTIASVLAVVLAGRLTEAAQPLRLLAVVVLAASWTPLLADLAGRRRLAAALFALPVALATPLVLTRLLPAAEPWLDARAVATAMNATAPPDAPLVVLEPPPPSLRLYARHNVVEVADPGAALRADPTLAGADGWVYVAVRGERAADALDAAAPGAQRLAGTPAFALVRARPVPPAGGAAAPEAAPAAP